VTAVVRALARHLPLRVACATGGKSARTQKEMLASGVDVLVGTPGRIQYLLEEGQIGLGEMKALVLDEVDVMFLDDTFDLSVIGAAAPPETQFIFVTATLPVAVAEQISKEFPGIKKLWGPGLHKVAPQVEEVLVDCSGPDDEERNEETAFIRKRDMLIQNLLRRPASRALVFCNSIPSCRRVENALRRADRRGNKWRVLPYHSAVDGTSRTRNLATFSREGEPEVPLVLVCTDRTSRGVDFDTADVEHVVLFDFPRDPSEYVRRVGRTGRAGRPGRVTALVLGKQVALARGIMQGNAQGGRVHPVPS
jgi:ATP-dependent RNA helicase DDX18/HAS1